MTAIFHPKKSTRVLRILLDSAAILHEDARHLLNICEYTLHFAFADRKTILNIIHIVLISMTLAEL